MAAFREQIKAANEEARAEIKKRGNVAPHPRILAWREAMVKKTETAITEEFRRGVLYAIKVIESVSKVVVEDKQYSSRERQGITRGLYSVMSALNRNFNPDNRNTVEIKDGER